MNNRLCKGSQCREYSHECPFIHNITIRTESGQKWSRDLCEKQQR